MFILDKKDRICIFVLVEKDKYAKHILVEKDNIMKKIIQQRLSDSISMSIPELIVREYRVPKIPGKVYAITGMRRTGKTYFLYQRIKHYLKKGVEKTRLIYFNFEDERLANIKLDDMHWIIDEYFAMFPKNRKKKVYFFFDEIQLIKGWEKFIRRITDSENVQVYISGSSAKMISSEIASSMRGRSIEITIYPYSFSEFLKNRNITLPSLKHTDKNIRSIMENQLLKYLSTGGFPEAQNLIIQDHNMLLQGYINTVIFRDIIERFNIKNISILKMLIRHIIQNMSCKFTVNKFYNQLKSQMIKASKTTLHEYRDYLRDVFLLYPAYIHTKSERKRMINPVKTYIIDTGLAHSFSIKKELETDHLLGNCVFMELQRRKADIEYLKTVSGYEIDFFVKQFNKTEQIIQVSADISNPDTLKREIRALKEAGKTHPDSELFLINISEEYTIDVKNQTINIIPAWKWLLDKPFF